MNLDTKVQVKSLTQTHQAVLVTVGMISAFLIGASLVSSAFAPFRAPRPIIEPDGPIFGEMKGWPKPIAGFANSTPLVVNLDSDAKLEIVQGARSKIYAYNDNGSLMSGWPYDFGDDSFVWDATSATDLDSDPQAEIVVATGKWWGAGKNRMYVFNHDGTLVPGWPKDLASSYNSGTSSISPAIGDIDNDGQSEIVFTYSDGLQSKLYAYEGDGSFVSGWPIDTTYFAWNQPVIKNIHGENRIVYGTRNELHLINGDGQSEYSCFPMDILEISSNDMSQVSVAPLGSSEVAFVFTTQYTDEGPPAIHAIDLDCEELPGWPYELSGLSGSTAGIPAIGDLNNDGNNEVVYKAFDSLASGSELLIINGDGTLNRSIEMPSSIYMDFSRVSLADVTGDKRLDIIGQSNYVIAWDQYGLVVPNFPINYLGSNHSEPVIADIDADGHSDLVFTQYGQTSYIHVYHMGEIGKSSSWTQSRHDAQNSGFAVTTVKPTCTDTDGGNVPGTKGTVSGINYNNVPYSNTDYCVDNQMLEMYCIDSTDGLGGKINTADLVTCENGCSDGACLPAS